MNDFIKIMRLPIMIVVVILTFFVNCYIPTSSMEPTFDVGDRFVTVRSIYCAIDRRDIINFKYPDDESVCFCKRVIGLPGDIIESKKGVVYINGTIFEEPYVNETLEDDWTFYIPKKGDVVECVDGNAYVNGYYVGDAELFSFFYCNDCVVKEDCYFCMGDNRTNSHDSRFWQNHFVKKSSIKSEFKLCYFSKNNIKHLGLINY